MISSFINFILVLLVLPESLDREKRERAALEYNTKNAGKPKAGVVEVDAVDEGSNTPNEVDQNRRGIVHGFLGPLEVFLPVVVMDGGVKRRRDWSLTFLAAAIFGYMLSQVCIVTSIRRLDSSLIRSIGCAPNEISIRRTRLCMGR